MEYHVAPRRGDPRVLLRLADPTAPIERWIPHRNAWVLVKGHEDIISPFSSYQGNLVSEEEAERLKPVVPDMSEEWVLDREDEPRPTRS